MNALEAKNVEFTYPNAGQPALAEFDLFVSPGTVHGLLGPNGAGKSTLLSLIVGLYLPQKGSLELFGQSVSSLNSRKSIGYVPQDIALYPTLTAEENLRFFAGISGIDAPEISGAIESGAERVGLQDKLSQRVETFSGGMKRRLNIAVSLLHGPKVLLLDEPTVGVDPQSRNSILELVSSLKESGSTIIYASHYMDEIEKICSDVTIIDHGKVIASGAVEDLIFGIERRVVVEFENDALSGVLTKVKELKGVTDVKLKNQTVLCFNANETSGIWDRLYEISCAESVEIKSFEIKNYSLEEKFIDLTGRDLRD